MQTVTCAVGCWLVPMTTPTIATTPVVSCAMASELVTRKTKNRSAPETIGTMPWHGVNVRRTCESTRSFHYGAGGNETSCGGNFFVPIEWRHIPLQGEAE